MPRFFDDYSNTYLTHDSAAGRKQQRRGWKFRENFKLHYSKNMEHWRRGHMGLASAQQAYVKARGENDPMIPPLPDGWIQEADDVTGILYYTNTITSERSWVRPGFFPPPPGPPPGMNHHRGPPQNYNNNNNSNNMGGFHGAAGAAGGFNRGPPPNRPPYSQQPPHQRQGAPPPFPSHQQPPPPGQYGAPPPPQFNRGPPPGYPPS
jgi:U1 small nuclear ribonucleoprotein C